MKRILLICLFFVTFLNVKSQDTEDVREKFLGLQPTGYVNDFQNLFTPEQKDTLEKMISDYEKKTSIEFALVTYYIDPMYYDDGLIDDFAEKWGVGKKNLNNGFLMFLSYSTTKGQSRFANLTGYGLESFLPDGKLNNIEDQIFPNTLYIGNVYEAYKQYILACQNELGTDGYDMLVENKRIEDEKRAAEQKEFFNWVLGITAVLVFLFGIGYIINIFYQRRKKYLEDKRELSNRLKSVEELKNSFDNVPIELQNAYNNLELKYEDLDKCKRRKIKKLISNDYLYTVNSVYQLYFDHKATINSINNSLKSISKSKSEIQRYLLDKYPHCEKNIKDQLNSVLNDINIQKSDEYSKNRMNYLIGIENSLDRKIKVILNKIIKINSIVVDNKDINKKVEELTKKHDEYIRKKNILKSVKIGNRTFNNIDFDDNISNIKNNIEKSSAFLINDNLDSALFYYGNYITTITILENAFKNVDVLFNEYNKSLSFIKENKTKLENLISEVDSKINKSGVSYSRKSTYENIKNGSNNTIEYFNREVNNDVIKAAEILTIIISSLTILLSSIKSDISSHNSYSSSSSVGGYSGGSYHSSGSGSSFGGFGGGSFGGGGSRGGF